MKQETINQLLTRLGIPLSEWDLLLVGDGSGSKYGYPVGWGCVALKPNQMSRKVYWGGANNGTVNVAEAMAYLIPLTEYAAEVQAAAKKSTRGMDAKNVHIITDSRYVQQRGNQTGNIQYKKNSAIWSGFEVFNRQGIFLHWHHAPRETVGLNFVADILSKEARKLFVGSNDPPDSIRQPGANVSEINPWD